MDDKSTKTLELPRILDQLVTFAAFSGSKALAAELRPSADYSKVLHWQKETTEARLLLSMSPSTSIGGAHDVRPQVIAASRGAVLEPVDFLDVKSTLIAARNLKRVLEGSIDSVPQLSSHIEKLHVIPGLVDAVSKVLDDRGRINDAASDRLSSIRRDQRVANDRLTSKLERMIGDPNINLLLQEPIITQRDGRFVIPLRAEFKGRIKAVIHDRSSSGSTLFIEPLVVVDLNNRVRELELAERDEIRRILTELSSLVGSAVAEIRETVHQLALLDLAFAKAKYAEYLRANEPLLMEPPPNDEANTTFPTLKLYAARHPLLDPDLVVPIDLTLDEGTVALVITGPNTGGKTVALKTTGLMALMAQCGMHIPAKSGSALSVFNGIYADIGDEQSIEQSLSTFSAHITNIIRILERVQPNSLVLLDELGAGTDPQEGASLAKALLGEFLRLGTMTLVATHYPEMKIYAHATPGVMNASVEFDLQSLQPTYHLALGLPGRSNALAIAGRLGLDESILDRARESIAPSDLQAENLLAEIHHQREEIRLALKLANESKDAAEKLKNELGDRLDAIEAERDLILKAAHTQASEALDQFRNELEDRRKGEMEQELHSLEEQVARMEAEIIEEEDEEQVDIDLVLHPGDRVWVRSINAEAVVTEIDGERIEVQVGRLRVQAGRDELQYLEVENMAPQATAGYERHRSTEKDPGTFLQTPEVELRLRGLTVDEALEKLERHLDAAYLAGMPFIRVIHGKGTGKLRRAVRDAVKRSSYVETFEPGKPAEGGEGVTVVFLAVG